MGSVEGYTRRVKRWPGGQMIQRWVASALVKAEPQNPQFGRTRQPNPTGENPGAPSRPRSPSSLSREPAAKQHVP